MDYDIALGRDDINRAIEFAKKFWDAEKSIKDFGSNNDRSSESDKLADTISGKLAEIAFAKFTLREFNKNIELDFNITTGKLAIDNGQDIAMMEGKIPILKTDIKGSKKYARWLLIEQHKIDSNLIIADFYVSVSLNLPEDIEKNWQIFETKNTINTKIDGYIKKNKFFSPSGQPWFEYHQNERLYSIQYIDDIVQRWKSNQKSPELGIMLAKEENDYMGNTRMGGPLKAKKNIGFPKKHLKSSKEEFDHLFSCLSGGEQKCV